MRSLLMVTACALGASLSDYAAAFEPDTHGDITRFALQQAGIDVAGAFNPDYASIYPDGIDSPIQPSCMSTPCSARRLIMDGSIREDEPFHNPKNHFHDPVTGSWETAGLFNAWLAQDGIGESSLLWQQDDYRQAFSWQDARREYLTAMTAPNEAAERNHLVRAMRALGHVVHLVQDAATPAHTRNDWHLSRPDIDFFHEWAGSNRGETVLGQVWNEGPAPDPALLRAPVVAPSGAALAPIANLIDSTEAGRAPVGCGTDIGIAEYSNARFMSDDTVFDREMPSVGEMILRTHPGPHGWHREYYHFADQCDAYDYRVAAVTTLRDYLVYPGLATGGVQDDTIMEDYGRMLLPRAVSYSAAILKYFFRSIRYEKSDLIFQSGGECHPCVVCDGCLQCQPYTPNVMPGWIRYEGPAGGDEPGAGRMYAVARATAASDGYVLAGPVDIALSREWQLITFVFNGTLENQYPGWDHGICLGQMRVVFEGQLGAEPKAVIGHWGAWGDYGGT